MGSSEKNHTPDSLIEIYNKLYSFKGGQKHPRKIRDGKAIVLGRYGDATSRNAKFMKFIRQNIPVTSSIHDAGCGRGYILKELLGLGYDASGTDCAESLFSQELKDLPATRVPYSDLTSLGEGRFDVVITNDVLEHLVDEFAVVQAIDNLVSITKDWLLISVGTGRAMNYPSTYRDLGIHDLHTVRRGRGWWKKQFNPYVEIIKEITTKVNWFAFCRKRNP